MKILVDAVLFQLSAGSAEAQLCARTIIEMASMAAARNISLTVLDRGGLPELGQVNTHQFPSFKGANSVADGEMLERMGRLVGADAFVSTALTMLPSVPNIQLLFGESEETLLPGRAGASEETEGGIAVAFSSAVVFASSVSHDAFLSRFPHPPLFRGLPTPDDADPVRALKIAELALDAAAESISVIKELDRYRKFLALRRMQAAFELSDCTTLAGQS